MDKRTLEVLGFPRIAETLAGMCSTDLGREAARAMAPSTDREAVLVGLSQLDDVAALAEEPPLSGIADLRQLLAQLRAGGVLTGPELLLVLGTCRAMRQCGEFLRSHQDELTTLSRLVRGIHSFPDLERELDRALDDVGAIRDSASTELARIRTGLRRRRNALVAELARLASCHPSWFSGGVTVRADRLVLPLRLEYRSRVAGVVHGSSGSGQTLFVEPLEAVAGGNEYQELRDAEVEETARILRGLSGLAAGLAAELSAALSAAAELDLVVAKRRFAVRYDCVRPAVAADSRVAIRGGRHPLLQQRGAQVVPLDFEFPDGVSVVLISGPNAGGKTVVLKTLGLFSLMLGCGMRLPAAGVTLPVFLSVSADIGDEQSLDDNLSSFTAHVARLREIVDRADERSLVLIDEIGASTAPEEGAALASAVLEFLRDRAVRTVATTHFGALKVFVQDEPSMANAAMEWGRSRQPDGNERLGPTYRLRLGYPGESSALEIAESAGLPGPLLDRARQRLGSDWLDLAGKLRALDEALGRAERAAQQAELDRAAAAGIRRDLAERLDRARREAAGELARARHEQERLLVTKRREIENLVRSIKERAADHESVVAAKAAVERGLAELTAADDSKGQVAGAVPEAPGGPIGPDISVWSRTFRKQGTVVEVRGSKAVVAFGQIRLEVDSADLEPVRVSDRLPESGQAVHESYRFDPHLRIIGMLRDEADEAVGRFLDDAAMAGADGLWVLHGKGAGVLRRMLWDRLRRDARVEQFRLAEPAQGGGGVTVVRLKRDQA